MAKLFLFAIGGSGSRVVKSLTMLLASGVKINADEIIPIIVDPHQSNEDLQRTVKALNDYQNVYKKLGDNREGFFSTKITTLKNLVPDADKLADNFSFDLKGVQNLRFRDYIDYTNLDTANKALASVLFSKDNLDTEMDIGFVGNPNIGSVVLNQFKDSAEFTAFASNFDENDRIFIISSIFGGTGAAGFPIILKNIRNANPPIPNSAFLQNSRIGAVTIMPYFGVEPGTSSKIDKATFISKTRAALSYYELNVSGNKSVNALYYLGDNNTKDYKNDAGEGGQRNDAHFVEMASAMAIIDFMRMDDDLLTTSNAKAVGPIYKDFGVKEDKNTLNFGMLGNETQQLVSRPLSKFILFHLFAKNHLKGVIGTGKPFAERTAPKIDSGFVTSAFFNNYLRDFNKAFEAWIEEMARNKRAFKPFDLSTVNLSEIFEGVKTKKGLFGQKKFDYKDFIGELNKFEKGKEFQTVEKKFMEVFDGATENMLNDYYDFFKN